MLFFILINIILFFFCLYLYFQNKKLNQKIIELQKETKTILERKIINYKEDLISIDKISIQPIEKKEEKIIPSNKKTEEHNNIELLSPLTNEKYKAKTNEDEKLSLKINEPTTISLSKTNYQEKKSNITNISLSQNFDPNEFIKSSKKETCCNNDKLDNQTDNEYLESIAKQIEKELNPKTIDLTEYEKNEEEQAVISYQELLSLKEKQQNESKQNATLLQDLKDFRKLLS